MLYLNALKKHIPHPFIEEVNSVGRKTKVLADFFLSVHHSSALVLYLCMGAPDEKPFFKHMGVIIDVH